MNAVDLRNAMIEKLQYALGKDLDHAQPYDLRMALSLVVRDQIVDPWFRSTRETYAGKHKRVYYLSLEFLIGRLLRDAVVNLGLLDTVQEVCNDLGVSFATLAADEPDAALGNGGLGRLAACFLDSLSTLGCPAYGYGIRYEHGLFRQRFENGRQIEEPEDWLRQKHVWEFERPEAAFTIGFGGQVRENGAVSNWEPSDTVMASAYDMPIIGWQGKWANTLRLWGAQATQGFDLESFNRGDFTRAAEPGAQARTISRVLYPDDTTNQGRELRLKQEYFFTAASLRDILRRFDSEYKNLTLLPKKVAIQLNDTHPAIAGPELVRILHDERGLSFDDAVQTAQACLSYTNHTLLPEALETWSEGLMRAILPRHMRLIEQIDHWHATANPTRTRSAIDRGQVKMGELSFIMAHKVNGVSALHTELMKKSVFAELNRLHPKRIINQTNGVTPRRWLLSCNPGLAGLIDDSIGTGWVDDLERLRELTPFAKDAAFLERFAKIKRNNKVALSNWFAGALDVKVDPDVMFDVQVKRIHEYKRQHLNILETIALWHEMRANPTANWTPRVKIFGGKAAPGYAMAKEIVHLINDVAAVINNDPLTSHLLKVVYPANYNVSMAERLIPAADLSEQISTAGKEASGTGNMKFALNGAPTIGTLDGANVEIREQVGAENFFLFGMTADQVNPRRQNPWHARDAIQASPHLQEAIGLIASGTFSPGDTNRYGNIASNLWDWDYFLVCSDFDDYYATQRKVDAAYADQARWTKMAALNVAGAGWFSSDRTIAGYMKDVWDIKSALLAE